MAMSDVVTGGFGTFSTVYRIPTKGFAIGEAPVVYDHIPDGVDYSTVDRRPHYAAVDGRPHYVVEQP